MKKLLLLAALAPLFLQAQDKGIAFDHSSTWQQIKAKAKAEHKYIFMDCFTTWCGPCKFMSAQVFPLEEVGNTMNAKFISVAVQLDSTAKDDAHVKSWYTDGHNIAAEYKIMAYPTYLFFDPNGELVHRAVGSSPADVFLTKANNALNPETQYYALLKKYKAGQNDSALLRKAALAALDAYDKEAGQEIAAKYLKTQTDLYTKSNMQLISSFTQSSKDPGFALLYKDPAKADEVLGKGVAEGLVQGIITSEEVYARFPRAKGETPNWQAMDSSLTAKYPSESKEVLAKAKITWYQYVKDWENYKTYVTAYMNNYSNKTTPNDLNTFAWTIFENCNDMACVEKALEWSKTSFAPDNNPMYIDTYANLLYKLGKKDEAIAWEEKAKGFASEPDKKGYQETIEKMKAGEKLWN